MVAHRGNYNSWLKGKTNFVASFKLFDKYGLENCFIELLEAKVCTTKDELKKLANLVATDVSNDKQLNGFIEEQDKIRKININNFLEL